MNQSTIRTAEFVLPGHPDKLADAIADAIVQEARTHDERALVGVEVALHRDVVFIDGRVACKDAELINFKKLVAQVYTSAGYGERFEPQPKRVKLRTDLCLGPLWKNEAEFREVADDQSIITGYACSTPGTGCMPIEQALVRTLAESLYQLAMTCPELSLGPDGKLIVLVEESINDGNCEWQLNQVSLSIQHRAEWNAVTARRAITECIQQSAERFAAIVPGLDIAPQIELMINGAGNFIEGGPHGDNGLSGKKLVVDFYGPRVQIGGGAMSGKDFWKADRAGPLIARELAIAAVQRLGCRECTVTLAICPGDRSFRIARVEAESKRLIDLKLLSSLVDLRLCSKGTWQPSDAGLVHNDGAPDLVSIARWGHFGREASVYALGLSVAV